MASTAIGGAVGLVHGAVMSVVIETITVGYFDKPKMTRKTEYMVVAPFALTGLVAGAWCVGRVHGSGVASKPDGASIKAY